MAEFDLSPTTPNTSAPADFHPGGTPELRGGLDPEIGLKGAGNPLGMIGQWADVQNSINQNRLFQQTFAARQKSGEILASSPDTDTAIKNLLADPVTAPFAGETINTLRQGQLALTQIGGEVQKQSQGVLDGFYKMLPAVIADPSQFDKLVQQALVTASPSARPSALAAMSSMRSALFDDLPKQGGQLTPKARMTLNSRLVGYSLGAGVPPEAINGLFGAPATRDVGTGIQSGVQLPSYLGGGFMGGNETPVNPAPTTSTLPLGPSGTPTTGVMRGNVFQPGVVAPSNAMAPSGVSVDRIGAGPSPAAIEAFIKSHGGTVESAIKASPSDAMTNALGQHGHDQIFANPLVGPSQAQGKANEATGGIAGNIAEEISSNGREIPFALKRFDTMTQAMGQFQAGGGASVRSNLAKLVQGLQGVGIPIPQSVVDKVGNESLDATQVFNANVKPLVIGELKAAAQGTGRVMRSEVDAFLEMMDNTNDPRALMTLLNQAKYALQVGYDQSQKYPQFKQAVANGDPSVKGLDPSDYYSWYNNQFSPSRLPAHTPGGMNLGPAPISAAKGAVPAGAQYKSAGDVVSAYKSGAIGRAEAKSLLNKMGHP